MANLPGGINTPSTRSKKGLNIANPMYCNDTLPFANKDKNNKIIK